MTDNKKSDSDKSNASDSLEQVDSLEQTNNLEQEKSLEPSQSPAAKEKGDITEQKSPKGSNAENASTQSLSASISLNLDTDGSNKQSNERKSSDQTPSSPQSTDKKTTKPMTSNASKKPAKAEKPEQPQVKKSSSLLAILALLIALLACAGAAGIYYLFEKKEQQTVEQQQFLIEQINSSQTRINEVLASYQQKQQQQIQSVARDVQQQSANEITYLKSAIAKLGQNQPSDWLIHEAEYLVRVASRTLWLEKDTAAAISLLQDADQRLQELNNPEFLPARQLIHQDIESLRILPTVDTESIVLKLIGLASQVDTLTFAMVKIPEATEAQENLELSEDAADWQSNLAITWQQFLKDFITVSRRTGSVEPLMAPKQQQNLRQNLQLKLQMAQWAATQGKNALYLQTLEDVTTWLNEYFDMEQMVNQSFAQSIADVATKPVSVDYPRTLSSLNELRQILTNKQTPTLSAPDNTISEQEQPEVNTTPTEQSAQPEASNDNENQPLKPQPSSKEDNGDIA